MAFIAADLTALTEDVLVRQDNTNQDLERERIRTARALDGIAELLVQVESLKTERAWLKRDIRNLTEVIVRLQQKASG